MANKSCSCTDNPGKGGDAAEERPSIKAVGCNVYNPCLECYASYSSDQAHLIIDHVPGVRHVLHVDSGKSMIASSRGPCSSQPV